MAYYAFFIEGIEVARTDKMLMQNEKEKKPAKCLPKTQNKLAVPVQFHSLTVEFSCKYVSESLLHR